MSQAAKALEQILRNYRISQNKLAVTMGVNRSTVSNWISQSRDPSANAIINILDGLKQINPEAAKNFIQLYLNESIEDAAAQEAKSKLEQLREKVGLTRWQVAEALGVNIKMVKGWEAGYGEPQLTIAQTKILVEILQCSLDELPDVLGKEETDSQSPFPHKP